MQNYSNLWQTDTYHASSTEEVSSSPTTSQGGSMQVHPAYGWIWKSDYQIKYKVSFS
jgi:hypothetical protein